MENTQANIEILIVEDDFISRSLLKKMLGEMGYQVVEVENGVQAWDIIQREPRRLIITDWMMPEMDGLQLCRKIRNAGFPFYIYVIMLTAKDRKKDLMDVFSSGADDYIPKPFDPEELKARVQTGLRIIELENSYKELQSTVFENRNRLQTGEIEKLNIRLIESRRQLEFKNNSLERTLKRLEETQAQILQSEKMASIGQLAAGVAHEINNPTGYVSSNLKTLMDYQADLTGLIRKYQEFIQHLQDLNMLMRLPKSIRAEIENLKTLERDIEIEYLISDIPDLINDCREGTERIKKIVIDLKDFAHPGEGLPEPTDINRGLELTLNVVHNELKQKATVHRDFGYVPPVHGYPQQLNQVFMNILVNAAQAIEKRGEIHVKTQARDGMVEVLIRDTGCGIAPENIPKIFDPFFTTKEVGKGTGLGMNIAYNIIKKHKGRIEVKSIKGEGSTFIVKLPVETNPQADEANMVTAHQS